MKFSILHLLMLTIVIAVAIALSIKPKTQWENMDVEDSLNRLTAAIRKHHPEYELPVLTAMDPAKLASLKTKMPYAPKQLFDLFELYDFNHPNIFRSYTLNSPSSLHDGINGQIQFYEEHLGPLEKMPWTSCDHNCCKLNLGWRKKWIPLGIDFGGDIYFIDMDPAEGGVAGQIVSTNEDGWYLTVEAYSIAHWLDRIAENVEAGHTDPGFYSCHVSSKLPKP